MTAYWAQFTREEILSMHGIELDENHIVDDDGMMIEGEEQCCSGCCMDCLGLSWTDFL